MGKRSDFELRKHGAYDTPPEAVRGLLPHLGDRQRFFEPCAGQGMLIDALTDAGHACSGAIDIEPRRQDIVQGDVFKSRFLPENGFELFITNPPWPLPRSQGYPTVDIAQRLSELKPTWLLLSADFAHNAYFRVLSDRCQKIVSIGRVSWMGNGISGFENCAWYLFDITNERQTQFFSRAA